LPSMSWERKEPFFGLSPGGLAYGSLLMDYQGE
jgi:hypothetical protein